MNIECALRRQSLSRVPNLGKPETYSRQHFDELTLQNKEKPLRELLVSIMEQERDDDLNSLSTQKRPVVEVLQDKESDLGLGMEFRSVLQSLSAMSDATGLDTVKDQVRLSSLFRTGGSGQGFRHVCSFS